MSAALRQKACKACAESKRKCDKRLPECQRCLDRDVDCLYPMPKKRRRNAEQSERLPVLQNHTKDDGLPISLNLAGWDMPEVADLDGSPEEMIFPPLPASVTSPPAQSFGLEDGNISSPPCPWFLREETWVLQHTTQEPGCVDDVHLEPFINAVDEMLQCWVKNGYNSFIHRRLFESEMPTCLQDAFTALAAYTNRTSAVKEIILQVVEERSFALIQQHPPTTARGAHGILAHLARTQALFVYLFIRLFDGSVRLRASAEQQLPVLREWADGVWQAVKGYRGEDALPSHHPRYWTANQLDREYNSSSELWKLWILTESIRRTHIIIHTIANVYETMTRGLVECAGSLKFTARHGLWDAESAVKWSELSQAKSPLLVSSLQPEPLISQFPAEEVDDFVKMFWTFIAGTDKIQYWIDKGSKTTEI